MGRPGGLQELNRELEGLAVGNAEVAEVARELAAEVDAPEEATLTRVDKCASGA